MSEINLHAPHIPQLGLTRVAHVDLHDMSLEIDITLKHHESGLQTLWRATREMLRLEMFPQFIVVDKVSWLGVGESAPGVDLVADMTAFMTFAVMRVEFVEGVEGLVTEAAFWMACEASEGDVFYGIAAGEVGCEFAGGVEDVFVRKDFFMLCA
jgi:hypothetical protein